MLTDLFQNLREFSISKQGIEIADVIIPDQSIAELRSSEKICLVQSFQELLDFDDTVDFAAKSPKVGTKITQKGGRVITCDPARTYPCGNACRSHSKDCKNPIEGQAKNYAGFLEQQSKKEGKIKDTKTSNKYNVAEVRKRFLDGEEMTIDQPDGTTARVKYVKDKDVNYLETYKGENDKPTSRPLMTTEEAEKYIDDMFKPQMVKAFGDPNPRFNTDSDKKLTNKAASDLDARRKGKAVAEKQVKDPISTTKQKKDDRDGAVDTTGVEKLEPRSAAQQEEDYYELGIPRDKQAKDGLPSTLERIKKFGYTPTEQELADLKSGDGRLYLKAWESIEDNSFDIRAEKVRGIRKEQKQIESQIDSLQAQKNDLLNEAEKIRDAKARRYGRSATRRMNKGLDAAGGDGRSMNDPKVSAQIYKLEDDAKRFDPQINDLIAKRNNLLIDARDLGAESIENPNNPRNQKPKEEPKSETLDKTKKSATGVKNIKIKFDDGETVDLTPDDIKVISGKDNLSLSEKKRLAKSPALVTLSKRIAETGDPALMKKYEGFALSGGVGTLDGSIPRAMLRDIDIHRAKKEIESAKKSGDKEKQATWEAELKRVETVAKTNLAGDPINTGKSANKSRTAKEDKPALETYGSKGKITELTKDNESQELDDFLNTPSKNHQVIYIGKDGSSFNSKRVIRSKDLGYITGDKARLLKKDKDAQFKQGLQSLETNREIGTTAYIKTPDGKFYESSDRSRMAKAITADEIRKRGLSDKPVEDKDPISTNKSPKAESVKLPKNSEVQINYDDDQREYSLKVPGANNALSNPNTKVYSKEDADDLANYLTSPMPGTKEELGNAYQFRTGKLIKSQKDFDGEFKKVFDALDKDSGSSGLVPIYKIRRALGDRLTRDDFDKYLLDAQSGDDYQGIAGELTGKVGNRESVIDSLYRPGVTVRTYIKKNDPEFSERPSQNFTWSRKNIERYKMISERRQLKA